MKIFPKNMSLYLQINEISCLKLSDNRSLGHYIACEAYGSQNVRDTEIGINALVAKEIGNGSKNKSYYPYPRFLC